MKQSFLVYLVILSFMVALSTGCNGRSGSGKEPKEEIPPTEPSELEEIRPTRSRTKTGKNIHRFRIYGYISRKKAPRPKCTYPKVCKEVREGNVEIEFIVGKYSCKGTKVCWAPRGKELKEEIPPTEASELEEVRPTRFRTKTGKNIHRFRVYGYISRKKVPRPKCTYPKVCKEIEEGNNQIEFIAGKYSCKGTKVCWAPR